MLPALPTASTCTASRVYISRPYLVRRGGKLAPLVHDKPLLPLPLPLPLPRPHAAPERLCGSASPCRPPRQPRRWGRRGDAHARGGAGRPAGPAMTDSRVSHTPAEAASRPRPGPRGDSALGRGRGDGGRETGDGGRGTETARKARVAVLEK